MNFITQHSITEKRIQVKRRKSDGREKEIEGKVTAAAAVC